MVEFITAQSIEQDGGIFGCFGKTYGFFPFFLEKTKLTSYFSTNGSSWNLAAASSIALPMSAKTTYRVKCVWDGKQFSYYSWQDGWRPLNKIASSLPIFGGTEMQFGLSRSGHSPFRGSINLSRCYISIGGKLWWEGVKGAYKNANK